MNKNIWIAIIFTFLGFISALIFGKESFVPMIFIIIAIPLYIMGFVKYYKKSASELKAEQNKVYISRASKELDALKSLYDQEMIDEKEYALKKESIKKQYSSQIGDYVDR